MTGYLDRLIQRAWPSRMGALEPVLHEPAEIPDAPQAWAPAEAAPAARHTPPAATSAREASSLGRIAHAEPLLPAAAPRPSPESDSRPASPPAVQPATRRPPSEPAPPPTEREFIRSEARQIRQEIPARPAAAEPPDSDQARLLALADQFMQSVVRRPAAPLDEAPPGPASTDSPEAEPPTARSLPPEAVPEPPARTALPETAPAAQPESLPPRIEPPLARPDREALPPRPPEGVTIGRIQVEVAAPPRHAALVAPREIIRTVVRAGGREARAPSPVSSSRFGLGQI